MSTIPAGWYPDPEREGATRWWDGQQWAPSQGSPAPGGLDDRFRRQDEGSAASSDGAGDGSVASTPAAERSGWQVEPQGQGGVPGQDRGAWQGDQHGHDQGAWQGGHDQGSWQSGRDQGAWQGGHDRGAWQGGHGAGDVPAQQATPSWGEPQGGEAQGSWQQPQHAAPQDWSTQSWSSQQEPPKRRTGLIVGISVGVVVLLGLLIGGGVLAVGLVGGIVSASQSDPGTGGPAPTDPGVATGPSTEGTTEVGETVQVTVAQDGEATLELVIEEDGVYAISVEEVNFEDPVLTVIGEDGTEWMDDDGGEGLNPLLEQRLSAGTYTIIVHEYRGDPLVADVTVTRL